MIAGLLLQQYSKLFVMAGFELKRDEIAKTICVKRNVANNTCKGNCHLKKKLAEEQEKQQESESQQVIMELVTPYLPVTSEVILFPPADEVKEYFNTNTAKHSFLLLKGIFHPPRCA